jgi:PAS domain-containing protein
MSVDSQGKSLLSFMDAPVLVGDPEGRVVFANPAFVRAFCADQGSPQGENLATLFAGGGREAVLAAVEKVCSQGEPVKFRLREGESGYLAVASPIEAEESRVGVIILMIETFLEPDPDAPVEAEAASGQVADEPVRDSAS